MNHGPDAFFHMYGERIDLLPDEMVGSSRPASPLDTAPALPLNTTAASSFAGEPIPAREFLDQAGLMPCRNVVLLNGDGGTGKSLLALQLALAVATGTDWIGIAVKFGTVVYFSAEEDRQEIHARLSEICAAEGLDLATATQLHIALMAGADTVLASENNRGVTLQTTQLHRRLIATLELLRPVLLVLDNLADVFSGNENNRSLAKQFIGLLRGLAIRHDCTVLLLAHPSLTGLNSGSGSSGSTAWSNSVRSRLYLRRDGDGSEGDETQHLLETKKANYGRLGQPIGLKWVDGRFVRSHMPKPFDDVSLADLERVQQAFQTGKYRFSEQSDDWGGFAVASVLGLDMGRGVATGDRSAEQNRNRKNVRAILATWRHNAAITVARRLDAKRMPKEFYSVPGVKHDDEL